MNLKFKTMKKLFVTLWIVFAILAIGWAILPFILADVLFLPWIGWFAILTIPSGIGGITMILLQRKMFKGSDF